MYKKFDIIFSSVKIQKIIQKRIKEKKLFFFFLD